MPPKTIHVAKYTDQSHGSVMGNIIDSGKVHESPDARGTKSQQFVRSVAVAKRRWQLVVDSLALNNKGRQQIENDSCWLDIGLKKCVS